jgi:transcriptional regulator with XRE-family HTH domain
MTKSNYSHIENGKQNITLHQYLDICEILNLDAGLLFNKMLDISGAVLKEVQGE